MKVLIPCLVLCLVFVGSFSHAEVPEKEILEAFNQKLSDLTNPESFKKFSVENTDLFPDFQKTNPSMVVKKEELKINDESFTLAIGYRQVVIDSKGGNFLKALWATPELFQKVYDLDGDSKIDDPAFTKTNFKARIFKKLPAIEDQDYTLEYTTTTKGNFTFIRAKLVKDAHDFALRDNLKVLEETKDGLIVREISYLYPLKWYVRALGPTARSTMKTELTKISMIEKCLAEENVSFPPSDEVIQKCRKH